MNKNYRLLITSTIILSIIVLFLFGYFIYDKFLKENSVSPKSEPQISTFETSISTSETSQTSTIEDNASQRQKKYEIITAEEAFNYINCSKECAKISYYLDTQINNVSNVENFITNYDNNTKLYSLVSTLSNKGKELTKSNVLSLELKEFGYSSSLTFADAADPFKKDLVHWYYNSNSEVFEENPDFLGYGSCDYNIINKLVDITNDQNNVYVLNVKKLWGISGGCGSGYYKSFSDAKHDTNSIYKVSSKDDITEYEIDSLLNQLDVYTYKMIKENGIIKILSYEKK